MRQPSCYWWQKAIINFGLLIKLHHSSGNLIIRWSANYDSEFLSPRDAHENSLWKLDWKHFSVVHLRTHKKSIWMAHNFHVIKLKYYLLVNFASKTSDGIMVEDHLKKASKKRRRIINYILLGSIYFYYGHCLHPARWSINFPSSPWIAVWEMVHLSALFFPWSIKELKSH